MDLSSVRDLKQELGRTLLQRLVEAGPGEASFGVNSRSISRRRTIQPGLALGIALGRNKRDFRLAVRLQERMITAEQELREQIEIFAKGEIDYRYVGRIVARSAWHRQRQRPLLIGCSVGHHRITAGTLGAFVTQRRTRAEAFISNNHVLANEDRGRRGDDIVQPGTFVGGRRPRDVVGGLLDYVPLKPNSNLVDAAIAEVFPEVAVDRRTLTGVGLLAGLRDEPIEPGNTVYKIGRTTSLTRGIVTAIELDDVIVGFDDGDLSFDRQIEIEGAGNAPFSAGGDSGSVIFDEGQRAFGLLFAGGDTGGSNGRGLTYANELSIALQSLDAELAL